MFLLTQELILRKQLNKKMDFSKILEQAKAMQQNFSDDREKFKTQEFTGNAGGGLVEVVLSGYGKAKKLNINSNLLEEKDTTIIQDLILAAFNNAVEKQHSASKSLTEPLENMDLSSLQDMLK